MNRISLFAVALVLMAAGSTSLIQRAKSQTITFGAERVPNIQIDKLGNLYLSMAVATLPSSAHTPGSQIFFTLSTDDGKQWNNEPTTENLSNSAINGIGALNPRMAITQTGPTRVYLGYDDDTTGFRQAWFIRSKKGTKFLKPVMLSQVGEGGFTPQVAVDTNGIVYVTWQASTQSNGEQTVVENSTDLGESFQPRIVVSGSSTTAEAPSIVADSNNVIHVVWQDSSTGSTVIMYSKSTNAGATFSAPVQISTGPGPDTTPQLGLDKLGGVNAIWVDQSGGTSAPTQIQISRSTDGGNTFSAPTNVTNVIEGNFSELAITPLGQTTYIAYQDSVKSQVFLTQSQSSQLSFQAPVRVSDANTTNGEARSPAMTADHDGLLHIVWIDTSIIGDQEGLMLYSTTKNGHAFAAPVEILAVVHGPTE